MVVDFIHSPTFSWDGSAVNLVDKSFGNGRPTMSARGLTAAFPVYATDGVHDPATGRWFQVFAALVGNADFTFDHLNPRHSRGSSTADAAVELPRREDEYET